jgi:Family of unknown function (DUF5329)
VYWPPSSRPARRRSAASRRRSVQRGSRPNLRSRGWYGAAEARAHLLRKLEAIEGRGTVKRSEQFIECAASQNSSSGKPYRVRCQGGAEVESQVWLTRQVRVMRQPNRP